MLVLPSAQTSGPALMCRNQPVAEELILQLLRHVASHPDDRRLEPLVLRCLQQLHPHNGGSVRGLRVVFKEDSAAEVCLGHLMPECWHVDELRADVEVSYLINFIT